MTTALILAALAIVAVLCLVSLMVMFVAGDLMGPDLEGLATLQLISIPVSVAIVIFVVALFVSAWGRREGLRRLWAAMPQWLVFAYVLVNSLTFIGELAMLVMYNAMGIDVPAGNHVPLLALLATTSAFLVLHARLQVRKGAALSGRWYPPDGPGTRGEPWEEDGF
jgi:hypothetical protein